MITVNEVPWKWRAGYTVGNLIEDTREDTRIFKTPGHGTIVLVNNQVLGILEKEEYLIEDGDTIRIIQAVGGG